MPQVSGRREASKPQALATLCRVNPALIDETSAIEFDQSPHLAKPQPKLLVAEPLSGHFATLPRVTVETFLAPTYSASPTRPTRAWCRFRRARRSQNYIDCLIPMLRALLGRCRTRCRKPHTIYTIV